MYALTDPLREAVYVHDYYARLRVSVLARMRVLEGRGYLDGAAALAPLLARITEVRDLSTDTVRVAIADDPFMRTCRNVKWLNGITVAKAMLYVQPDKCHTPASLWAYCGVGVTNGLSDRVNSFIHTDWKQWNPQTFTAICGVRANLLRKRGPYRWAYDRRRVDELHKGHYPGISHRRAVRYTTKLWLKHCWIAMRVVHSLPLGQRHENDRGPDPTELGWDWVR